MRFKKQYTLFLLLLFTLPGFSQYKYWMSKSVSVGNFLNDTKYGKNQRVKIYTQKKGNTTYLKLVNNSCFDTEYAFKFTYKNSYGQKKANYSLVSDGILRKGNKKYLKKYVGSARYISFERILKYINYELSGGEIAVWTYARIVQPEKVWSNDIVVLKCLGFNSHEAYKKAEKKYYDDLDKKRIEMAKKEKLAKLKKQEEWVNKGLDYHINHYNMKVKKGFFYPKVPVDSLSLIARHTGKYFLAINTGPKAYKDGALKLTDDQKYFLESQTVTSFSTAYDRKFYKWIKEAGIQLKFTPAVILLDPNGKVLFQRSLNTTQMKNEMSGIIQYISENLEILQED